MSAGWAVGGRPSYWRSSLLGRLRPLLGRVELVAQDVATGLLESPIQRRLQEVGIGQVCDLRAPHDPQPDAFLAAAVELARVVHRGVAVGRADVAGVAHRLAVLLLAEDLPHARVGAVAHAAGFVAPPLSRWRRLVISHQACRLRNRASSEHSSLERRGNGKVGSSAHRLEGASGPIIPAIWPGTGSAHLWRPVKSSAFATDVFTSRAIWSITAVQAATAGRGARMVARTHAVSSWLRRRKARRSCDLGPWPVTTVRSSCQSGSV